jgi:DNA polymerase III subunit gamma/tau
MNLALEFRPRKFSDIAGQPWVSLVLEMMVTENDVPEALIFHGCRGTGKTSTARILGAALNCEGEGARPCLECESCRAVRKGNSVDVIEVDAATNGKGEDIQRICDMVTYDVGSKQRVVVLDEAHGVSPAGFNKLLKTFEEPPPGVTFVLVTTEYGQIPQTIKSRASVGTFRFKRMGLRAIIERLVLIRDVKDLAVEDAVLAAIAERADGGMRDAIMLLDQTARARAGNLDQFYELTGEGDFAPGLLSIMASGRLGDLYDRLEQLVCDVGDAQLITVRIVRCLRDILVLHAGGTTVTAQGEALAMRKALAARLTDVQVVGAMRVFWDLQRIRSGNDPRMVLDLAAVMAAEQFAPQRQAVALNGNGHRKAEMADVRALIGG